MAIRFDTVNEYLSRTTNLPPIGTATIMAWVYLSSDRNTDGQFFEFGGTVYPWYQVGVNATGTTLATTSTAQNTGTNLSTATWYHVAVTISGTGAGQVLTYLNGSLDITNDGDPTYVAQDLRFGMNDTEWIDGRMAAIKVWDVALSVAEIQSEMRQYVPVKTDSLNCFYPCQTPSDYGTDYSGNARAATVNGSVSFEDGPPIPWRQGRHRFRSPVALLTNSALSGIMPWMVGGGSAAATGGAPSGIMPWMVGGGSATGSGSTNKPAAYYLARMSA